MTELLFLLDFKFNILPIIGHKHVILHVPFFKYVHLLCKKKISYHFCQHLLLSVHYSEFGSLESIMLGSSDMKCTKYRFLSLLVCLVTTRTKCMER